MFLGFFSWFLSTHLTVNIRSCIQQHLYHCLISTNASIHQRGHALHKQRHKGRLWEIYSLFLNVISSWYFSRVGNKKNQNLTHRPYVILSKSSTGQILVYPQLESLKPPGSFGLWSFCYRLFFPHPQYASTFPQGDLQRRAVPVNLGIKILVF